MVGGVDLKTTGEQPKHIFVRLVSVVVVRLVQVSIPTGRRETIRKVLERRGIDYVITNETSGRRYAAVAYFPLPQGAVEPILEELRAVGLAEDAFTVVVEANTVISRNFEALQAEYDDTTDEDRVAREELTAAGQELLPSIRNYVILSIVSAVVATAGLLLDSPSVVVGSMVIAPLVGPALAGSVGTVLGNSDLSREGATLQVIGVVLSVLAAGVFTFGARVLGLVPPGMDILAVDQINERLAPDLLSLAIAIGAGVAGALSLSAGVSTALVGVMIAVALIPPAAAVGIGIAWGTFSLAVGAGVLVLVNLLSINLAALLVLWGQGYRPEAWREEKSVRRATWLRIGGLAVAIMVLGAFLGGVTVANNNAATAEATIETETQAVIDQYESLTLLDITIETASSPLNGAPTRVTVTVGTETPTTAPPPIRDELQTRLGDDAPAIEVRFVTVQTGG